MLQNFRVKNYKGIKDLVIPKMTRLTLIGGKNNSGKSSLMESMLMVFNRMDPHIIIRPSLLRGIAAIPSEPDFMWAPIFNDFDLSKKIELSGKFNSENRQLEISIRKDFKRSLPVNNIQAGVIPVAIGSTATDALSLKFSDGPSVIEQSLITLEATGFNLNIELSKRGAKVPVAYFSPRQASNLNEDSERLGRVELSNSAEHVTEILRYIVPEIKTITAIRIQDSSLIYADIGKSRKVPIAYMGDGISRLLSIILAIATCKGGIIFVDEIENGLHYSVIENIWCGIIKAAKIFNCQIIATTHSHEFLVSACTSFKKSSASDNEFSYIRLVNRNDSVSCKIFDKDLLDFAIESEMEIR